MITSLIVFAIAFWLGWIIGRITPAIPRDRDPDWGRSFTHERTDLPTTPRPLKWKRSGGYQPLAQSTKTNPPPRNP
jgi:hypothetical protein